MKEQFVTDSTILPMGNILEASLKIALEKISEAGILPNYNLIFQVYDEQVCYFVIISC